MMSVSNAYMRAANFHFKNLKDKSADEFDTKVACTLVGRATRWELPPPDVVEFLFGEWWFVLSCEFQCLSMGVRAREQWDRMEGVRMTFPHGDDCY